MKQPIIADADVHLNIACMQGACSLNVNTTNSMIRPNHFSSAILCSAEDLSSRIKVWTNHHHHHQHDALENKILLKTFCQCQLESNSKFFHLKLEEFFCSKF